MPRKLRILSIGHSYVVALNRAVPRAVAADGDFEVTVAAPRFFHGDLHDLALEAEPAGSPLEVVGLAASRTRRTHIFGYDPAALRRLVEQGRFDIVQAWEEPFIYAGYQIARALRRSDARFCFWTAQNYSKRLPPPFGHFERSCLARAQGWIAAGHLVRQAMIARGYPTATGQVITLAVDTTAFRPVDPATRPAARERLGLTGPVIGFVGRLTPEKGLPLLLRVLERLGGERPWSLLVLGSGPLEGELRNWAASRGWSSRLRVVLARHDEVPTYLGAMDVLTAPSQTTRHWREQFGRMLIEAFACGVPVVASDSAEIPFVVGDAGLVVGERDEQGWAVTLGGLLSDPARRAELARRGLERCGLYSVPSVAAQYQQFYRDLAARPTRLRAVLA